MSNKKNRKRGTASKKNTELTPAKARGTANAGRKKKKPTGFAAFVRRIKLIFAAIKKELKKSNIYEHLPRAVFITGAVLVVFISIFLLTNKNAYRVLVGSQEVSIIKKDKKVTPDGLLEAAISKVESDMGTAISVNEAVEFRAVHAAKKEIQSPDLAILRIADAFTYEVEAVALKVEGTTMAIVKNRSEAEQIENAIIEPYLSDELNIIDKGFVENYMPETVYVAPSEITSMGKALEILTATTPTLNSYRVVSGDNFTSIAANHGMTLNELLSLNPNHDVNSLLVVGEVLTVQEAKPVLSVRLIIEVTQTEVEPKTEQVNENPSLARGYRKSVQYGSDGQSEVTYHITRINGIPISMEEVNREYTVPAVPEIIEVGTG